MDQLVREASRKSTEHFRWITAFFQHFERFIELYLLYR
jgi:hypothetical protein